MAADLQIELDHRIGRAEGGIDIAIALPHNVSFG